jgi:hypothetical protein
VTRLNYTNRVRITREKIHLELVEGDPNPRVTFTAALAGYELDPEATVALEARRQTRFMRLTCGTVADPMELDRAVLGEFPDAAGIQFRVKVTDPDGRIAAAADRLRPSRPDAGESPTEGLLPFRAEDLGREIWRLDLDDDNPIVKLNNRLPDWKSVATSSQFRSLVYPQIVRAIALWALDRPEPEEGVVADWRSFIGWLGAELDDPPETDETKAQWANDVVDRFCTQNDLLTGYLSTIEDG